MNEVNISIKDELLVYVWVSAAAFARETGDAKRKWLKATSTYTVNFLVWKHAKSLVNYRCDYTPLTRSVRFTPTGECEHQCTFLMIFMARYNPRIYCSCVVHISESQQLSPSPEK